MVGNIKVLPIKRESEKGRREKESEGRGGGEKRKT